jgi:putative heme-binding domain-containing protein
MQRPTDFDVDGSGRLYVSSWQGATFNYNGPNAGFVLRITPPSWKFKAFPDLQRLSEGQLLEQIASPSSFARLYAQREMLRRGMKPALSEGLEKVAQSNAALASRVAAIFTLRQLAGPASHPALLRLVAKDDLREFALRALADDSREKSTVPAQPFVRALTDANPRVRLQAATALGRMGKTEAAASLIPLTADADPIVSHVAVHSLVQLRASEVCLKAFESAGSDRLQPGAARVLQALHETAVVDGVIAKLNSTTDSNSRKLLLTALARLCNREDDWNGKWWGTRPDTTGPYYKPVSWSESEKIQTELKKALAGAQGETLSWLVVTLHKNRVDLPELTSTVLKLANSDSQFRSVAVELFSGRAGIPDEAILLFGEIARSSSEPAPLRAKAIRALAKSGRPDALHAAVAALTQTNTAPNEINAAWEEFARDTRHSRNVNYFVKLADEGSAPRQALAYAVLANMASGRLPDRGAKTTAAATVESGWSKPASTTALLQGINRLKLDTYAERVRILLNDSNPEVAAAARTAAKTLKIDQQTARTTEALIEKLKYEDVAAAATNRTGNPKLGAEMFAKAGCVACHTMNADEPPKGPFLGGIGTRYSRAELCESILRPSAKIAQGFETQYFKTKDDEEVEGFVTREGGDDLDVRNVAGIVTTLIKKNIAERGKRETSIMPLGLADKLTPSELASLISYLESAKK